MEPNELLTIARSEEGGIKYRINAGVSTHEAIGALEIIKQALLSEILTNPIINENPNKDEHNS